MRLRFTLVFGLTLALMVTASQGAWKMQVHYGGQTEEFTVSEIDSLTFRNDVIPPVVIIPAGSLIMGSPVDEYGHGDAETQHNVTLPRSFEMFTTEVTNQQYMEAVQWACDNGQVTATTSSVLDNLGGSVKVLLFMDDNSCEIQFDGAGTFYLREAPYYWAQQAYPDGYNPANHPVFEVSWYGAVRYCDWLSLQAGLPRAYEHSGDWSCNGGDPYGAEGYRLPTEAEWEYACRAGTPTPFNTGDCLDARTEANYRGDYPYSDCPSGPWLGWTAPVGSYPSNDWGLYDIHASLNEWCNDWYGPYGGDEIDPVGVEESRTPRVYRSGTWTYGASSCRSASRHFNPPFVGGNTLGFRAVKTIN